MDLQTFNQSVYDTLAEIMGEMMPDLVSTFLEDGALQLKRVKESIHSEDIKGLMVATHTLKSSANTLGAEKLGEYNRQLEHLANESLETQVGLDNNLVVDFFNKAEAEFSLVRQQLKAKIEP